MHDARQKGSLSMPSNLVKTPEDEMKWSRAKQAIIDSTGHPENQFTQSHWKMVTSLFERMKNHPGSTIRGPEAARGAKLPTI